MQWSDLRYVLAAARGGTLAAAARRLRVDQTTVARRIAAAETALGARLFERVGGALTPTAAGEVAVARAAEVEQTVERLERGIGGADAAVAGPVRLTAVPLLVNHLLVPAVPDLLRRHLMLRLELIADSRNANLTRREADVALRLARPETGTAVTRRIGRLDYAVYAPVDRDPAECLWITYEDGLAHLPQARWIAATAGGAALSALRVNDAEAILRGVQAGLGKSVLPVFVAEGDPLLRRVGPAGPVLSREIWLMTHRDLRLQPRIIVVIEWLEALIEPLAWMKP